MKQHYEKVICACCFLIMFVNVGLPSTSFSVYQPYIVALPGVGDTGGSTVVAVRTGVSLLCMFFVTMYYRVLNVRIGAFVASVLVAVGFLVFSLANDLAVLCIASAIIGAGYGLGGMVAVNLIISRWFESGLGSAVGVAAVGSGVAGMSIPPIMAGIIEGVSLPVTFRTEAAIALVLGAIVFAFMRNYPSALGLSPHRAPEKGKPGHEPAHLDKPLPRPVYIAMLIAMVCLGCVSVDAVAYYSILFVSEGMDRIYCASLIAAMGACLTVGKAVSGVLFDRIGTRNGSVVLFAIFITGVALTIVAAQLRSEALAMVAAVVFGFGLTLGTVGISMWSLQLTTVKNLPKTIRNFQIAYAFGGFSFNIIPGVLKEIVGNYMVSYVILLVMTIICAVIVIVTYTRFARQ